MKQYTTEEKIGFLQETSMTCKEIKACNINFKIGFRAAAELMK